MRRLSRTTLLSVLSMLVCSPALAEGPPPPPGWGQPRALPPANGDGQVTFKHGGNPVTLPLNKIEIDTSVKDMFIVSLTYVDPAQENRLELTFGSMPRLGKNDPRNITGFLVKTKAKGLSRAAANRSKCDLAVVKVTGQEVSGTLSCTGLTDMSAETAAPDVTDVRFDGKLKAR
jgi:hypothetical protein